MKNHRLHPLFCKVVTCGHKCPYVSFRANRNVKKKRILVVIDLSKGLLSEVSRGIEEREVVGEYVYQCFGIVKVKVLQGEQEGDSGIVELR